MNSEEQFSATEGSAVDLCCRVCLQLEDLMVHIYEDGVVEDLQSDLSTLLERCGGIKIEKSDNFPKFLCKECTSELLVAAKFREKCERAQQLLVTATWNNTTELEEALQIDVGSMDTKLLSQTETTTDLQLLKIPSKILEMPIGDNIEINLEQIKAAEEFSVKLEDAIWTGSEEVTSVQLSCNDFLIEDTRFEKIDVEHLESAIDEEENALDIRTAMLQQENSNNVFIQQNPADEFTCDSCGAVFLQASNLQRHLEKVHLLFQPYICANCSYAFSLEESYRNHSFCCIKSNTPVSHTKINLSAKLSATSTQRECVYCGKHMQSTFALNMHLRTHTGERPYKCTLCPKTFKTQSACSMHLKRHARKPDYACSVCNKTFYETSNLTAHMRIHTGEKPHSCSMCQKRFSRVFLLQLHMRTHTGEKPYHCSTCTRAFAQLCDLRNHERMHSGERPFKCNICAKTFIKRYALNAHLERHAVIQPEEACTVVGEENMEIAESTVAEVQDETVKYMLEDNMLEDSYFLPKATEDSFCGLSYENVSALNEPTQELAWNDFIVEEI